MSIYFTEDHEWIRVEDGTGTVGISPYAATQLGDIVFVELPDVETELVKGKEAAVVESVKAASEVYAPVSGTVTHINDALEDAPETVNSSADEKGWFFKMKMSDASELESLMNAETYKSYCDGL